MLGPWSSAERRDEVTVTIVAGLVLFLVVTALGAVALVVLNKLVELDGDVRDGLVYVVLGCAVALSFRYIYRHSGR